MINADDKCAYQQNVRYQSSNLPVQFGEISDRCLSLNSELSELCLIWVERAKQPQNTDRRQISYFESVRMATQALDLLIIICLYNNMSMFLVLSDNASLKIDDNTCSTASWLNFFFFKLD